MSPEENQRDAEWCPTKEEWDAVVGSVTPEPCQCVHETCTDGRVCRHLKPDTAGAEGERPEPGNLDELTPTEVAEIHDGDGAVVSD
jgi:hypothetical protein